MPRATWGSDVGNRPWESDLDEYDVYEGEQPPKGVYRCRLKVLRLKQNRNKEPMLNGLLVITEPKKSPKAKYNGYSFWFNLNVTKQGTPWVNNFLSSLVEESKVPALRKAFWAEKVMIDQDDPPNILSIGTLKLNLDEVGRYVKANTKLKRASGDYDETLDVLRFLRDAPVDNDDDGEDEPEDDADEGYEEESEEDSDVEDFEEREEELAEMTTAELKKILKGHGFKLADYRGLDNEELIEMIMDKEFPEEDEEDEPEEEEPADETDADDYEEEVAEEEPKKSTRRGSRRASSASSKPEPEPPARGTRGRRRKAGEPPF